MLLDSSGVVLATSSGTMNKNLLSEGRDFIRLSPAPPAAAWSLSAQRTANT